MNGGMGQVESSTSSQPAPHITAPAATPAQQHDVEAVAADTSSTHTSPSDTPLSNEVVQPSSPASTVAGGPASSEPSLHFIPSPIVSRKSSTTIGALEGEIGGEKFQICVARGQVKQPTLRPSVDGNVLLPAAAVVHSAASGNDFAGGAGGAVSEGGASTSVNVEPDLGDKRKRDSRPSEFLESLRRADVGKVVELYDDELEMWLLVRILDVIGGEVQVCPEGEATPGRHAWGLKWVDFEEKRFRKALVDPAAQSNGELADDPRSMRARGEPGASNRGVRLAATPAQRALALERGGGGRLYSPEKPVGVVRARKRTVPKVKKEKEEAKESKEPASKVEVAKKPSPPPPEKPQAPARKKDWGLMQIDVVGRHRPPFAKTLLCHGTVQAGVRLSGEPVPASNWVVKRWSDKPARRKVDFEVHEKIRANPCEWVVEIAGVHTHDGVLMEFCREGDLQSLMSTGRRRYTPVKVICILLSQIMKGLAHLHSLNIVHSDVSPGNAFLRKDKGGALECVLGDFGHSYVVEIHAESRSSVHAGQGSIFVAPEVIAGSSSSMASDIYSAGRILEQMLAASKQFKEEFAKESKVLVRTLQNLAKDMMHENPKQRPSSSWCRDTLCRAIPRESPKAAKAAQEESEEE